MDDNKNDLIVDELERIAKNIFADIIQELRASSGEMGFHPQNNSSAIGMSIVVLRMAESLARQVGDSLVLDGDSTAEEWERVKNDLDKQPGWDE